MQASDNHDEIPEAELTAASIDITLVVNIHDGASYLARTLMSIEEAAHYASGQGIRCELLFVMDRSPAETLAWVEAYRSDAFAIKNTIEVNNGSLGLSRNDGLHAARGEIVLFCDEDDLISYNLIADFHSAATANGADTVIVPEYCLVFGTRFLAYRYFGSGVYSPFQFISGHPFTSRICIHRRVVEKARFDDVRLSTGFAYEDYHFNSKLAALGFRFRVVPNTIIFYREKAKSLLRSMTLTTSCQIPPTPLFEPPIYLSVCAADYAQRHQLRRQFMEKSTTAEGFFTNPTCLELTHAANRIDPGIDISRAIGNSATTLGISQELGVAYYEACKKLDSSRSTDVVLLPFISKGHGEKYILNVLDAIQRADHDARFLILAGQRCKDESRADRIPKHATFLHLPSLHPDLTDDQIDILTLRVITATAASARVHVQACPYTHRFIAKFGHLLSENRFIYYRFADGIVQIDGQGFTQGASFDFISENVGRLDCIVTDNCRLLDHDVSRLDMSKAKWKLLYAPVDPRTTIESLERRRPVFHHRLLWPSELDREKRLELLCDVADCLWRSDPRITIDVYGAPAPDDFDTTKLKGHSNLNYCGTYDGFGSISHAEYDGLIFTSAFDGLRNAVLEALSAGLPVIGPDIDGLGEVVIPDETGILVQSGTDAELIERSAAAIASLYADAARLLRLRCSAIEFVNRRHSFADFRIQVDEVFKIGMNGTPLSESRRAKNVHRTSLAPIQADTKPNSTNCAYDAGILGSQLGPGAVIAPPSHAEFLAPRSKIGNLRSEIVPRKETEQELRRRLLYHAEERARLNMEVFRLNVEVSRLNVEVPEWRRVRKRLADRLVDRYYRLYGQAAFHPIRRIVHRLRAFRTRDR